MKKGQQTCCIVKFCHQYSTYTDQKKKDNGHYKIHTETKVEISWARMDNAQSGNYGEGRGREDDQIEDSKMT